MKKLKCRKCGYEWAPRTEKPKACPRCKQYDWEITTYQVVTMGDLVFEEFNDLDLEQAKTKAMERVLSFIHDNLNGEIDLSWEVRGDGLYLRYQVGDMSRETGAKIVEMY